METGSEQSKMVSSEARSREGGPQIGSCSVCLEPMVRGAKVCSKCQRDQSSIIRNINRFGGVVAAAGLIITVLGVLSARSSADEAEKERIAAEAALKKTEIVEIRIDELADTISKQAEAINIQARAFYESRIGEFRDLYQESFGSCQVGPELTCFSYYRQAMNLAWSIMSDAEAEIFKEVDDEESITFLVCNYVREMKDRSTYSMESESEGKVMASQTFDSASKLLAQHCA